MSILKRNECFLCGVELEPVIHDVAKQVHPASDECEVLYTDEWGIAIDLPEHEPPDEDARENFLDEEAIQLQRFPPVDEVVGNFFTELGLERLGGQSSGSGWSSFSLYQRCPYAWKRRYLDQARPIFWTESPSLAIGTLVHAFLALYYSNMMEASPYRVVPPSALYEYARAHANPEFVNEAWRVFSGYEIYYKHEIIVPLAVEHDLRDPRTNESCRYDLIAFFPEERPGMLPGTYIIESKCVTGDTLVHDFNQNRLLRVDELFRFGAAPRVLAYDITSGTLVRAQASVPFANGVKPIIEIVSESGRRVRATDNHPFWTPTGWRRADQLAKGDWVAIAKHTGGFQDAQAFSDADLRLLGFMLAEGNLTSLTFSQCPGSVFDAFLGVVDDLGLRVNVRDKQYKVGDEWRVLKSARLPTTKGTHARELFGRLALYGLRSAEKFVPREFDTLSDRQIGLFVGALWDGDGCQLQSLGRTDVTIKYTSRSQRLAEGVRDLLLRLGIRATTRKSWASFQGTRYDVYFTSVVDRPSKRAFLQAVIDDRILSSRLRDSALGLIGRVREGDDSAIPLACFAGVLRAGRKRLSNLSKGVQQQMMVALNKFEKQPRAYVERHTLAKWAEQLPELQPFVTAAVWWEQIDTTLMAGWEQTYDLTVPGPHSFVANGAIVHNTASRFDWDTLNGWQNDGECLGEVALWKRLGLDKRFGPLRGLMVNILGKQKDQKFHRTIVAPSTWQIDQHLADLKRWQGLMNLSRSMGVFPRARAGCINRYGACEHWEHCLNNEN